MGATDERFKRVCCPPCSSSLRGKRGEHNEWISRSGFVMSPSRPRVFALLPDILLEIRTSSPGLTSSLVFGRMLHDLKVLLLLTSCHPS